MVLTGFENGENGQIPRRGYILLKGQIEQNLGGCQKLVVDLGPKRWLNHWLSVTIASIQSLKKVACTPLHFWKRSPGVVFLLTFNPLKFIRIIMH